MQFCLFFFIFIFALYSCSFSPLTFHIGLLCFYCSPLPFVMSIIPGVIQPIMVFCCLTLLRAMVISRHYFSLYLPSVFYFFCCFSHKTHKLQAFGLLFENIMNRKLVCIETMNCFQLAIAMLFIFIFIPLWMISPLFVWCATLPTNMY